MNIIARCLILIGFISFSFTSFANGPAIPAGLKVQSLAGYSNLLAQKALYVKKEFSLSDMQAEVFALLSIASERATTPELLKLNLALYNKLTDELVLIQTNGNDLGKADLSKLDNEDDRRLMVLIDQADSARIKDTLKAVFRNPEIKAAFFSDMTDLTEKENI